MTRLEFNKSLAPRAGKPIAISELLRRLESVHGELQRFDQGDVDLTTLEKVAKELISNNLIKHKDKGVRAYTASCLADVLRLFAPDAPYTVGQLQIIFHHFVSQLKELADNESPYFAQYYYLLESLSQVKSVVLVADLPNGEAIMSELFQMFFDMAKPEGLKNLEFHMTEILVQLIEESPTIPRDVVTMILAQFLRTAVSLHQSSVPNQNQSVRSKVQTRLTQQIPPAYSMAKTICINCSDRMARQVSQYFTDVIYDMSTKTSSEEVSETDLTELRKAHSLIVEIWKASPDVLLTVIPHLEQEIFLENVDMRLIATQTIGLIAGEIPGRVNFISSHPSCWEAWLGRQNDKSFAVRAQWAQGCAFIIGNRLDVVKGTVEGLGRSLVDIDDRVRLAACRAIGDLDYKTIVLKFKSEQVLKNLAERVRDLKTNVRTEAISVLGNLYDLAYDDIAANDEEIIRILGWIPSRIFELIYVNSPEMNLLMDLCIHEKLMPFDIDDKRRVTRMLTVVRYLDEKLRKVFKLMANRQKGLSNILNLFVQLCEKYNGGVCDDPEGPIRTKLDQTVKCLADMLPDPIKIETTLNKFVDRNDRRMYKLIRDCISSESEYKIVYKAISEFKSKAEQIAGLESFVVILYRSSPIWYSRSNMANIIAISKDSGSDGLLLTARELLKDVSESMPAVLKVHIRDLIQEIQTSTPGGSGNVNTLKACAEYAKSYPDDLKVDKPFIDSLLTLATKGDATEAKYAVIVLMQTKRKIAYARELLGVYLPLSVKSEDVLAHLAGLASLVLWMPGLVEPEIDRLTAILIKEVLLQNRIKHSPEDKTWVDDLRLDQWTKSKVLALQILVNRVRAAKDAELADEIAQPVLKLLISLITNGGEMSRSKDTPAYTQSRLRLCGGLYLLKLAKLSRYERMIQAKDINSMGLLVQDKEFQVRSDFVDKLKKYLSRNLLAERYMPLVFLMAYEPEEESKQEVAMWIRARTAKLQQLKKTEMERNFARLLHLLAHHPDFGTSVEDMLDFTQYILYYLNSVATIQNVSLIFYFAQRVKQVRDAVSPNDSEKLYYMSDLGQAVIRRYVDAHGWSIQTWPGRAPLPGDLFKAIQSSKDAQEIARTVYLQDGIAEKLSGLIKTRAASRPAKTANPTNEGVEESLTMNTEIDKKGVNRKSQNSKRKSVGDRGSSKKKRVAASDDEYED
ncbi:armadillo-type protein [Lipomyces oligophaga]|uniref:armadillo-type protein n=1 Tax=Lipomyces oligophaga TaxID=45792 RepID=UPI0034CFFB68